MTSRMPNSRRTLALAAFILATACGGGDLVAPTLSAADTYTLHSFNGAALPALISADAQSQVSLLDDTFAFYDGGSYLERGHLRTMKDGVETIQTLESPGTYSRDGSSVTLISSSGTINGSFTDGQTLTIVAGTNTLVFRR
jgi:hypothetical protein